MYYTAHTPNILQIKNKRKYPQNHVPNYEEATFLRAE